MRRQNLLLCLFICAPLAFASCDGGQSNANGVAAVTPTPAATTQATPTPAPKPQEVTALVEEVKLDAGGTGEASVRLDIIQGYHIHANPAADKFYIATVLSAEAQDGITPGKPVYPPGASRKLPFFDKPLSLYEGSVRIKLPLRADKNALKGRHTLRAKLRVQPCNDKECFAPRDIDAPINVTIN
jgi:cytochrome c biogenesis DsbD-like protein